MNRLEKATTLRNTPRAGRSESTGSMSMKTSRPVGGGAWLGLGCAAVVAATVAAGSARAEGEACAGASKPRVNVIVEGVRSDRGELVLELYPNDPKRFLAHLGRVERIRPKAARSVTSACIVAPTAGLYALVMYHDENNDELFNRSSIGLPSEGFGFSNNVRPLLGPPSLKSVLFQVPEGESTIRVRMRYIGGSGGRG
jgi:uncharacterized protein (DUF2141 family)